MSTMTLQSCSSTTALAKKAFKFINSDFNAKGTLFKTTTPLDLEVTNATIINYEHLNAGFILEVECNFENASLTGEIVFDNLNFERTDTDDNNLIRIGSLIKSTAPANLTITNSNFTLHYNELEDLDTFVIQDSSL